MISLVLGLVSLAADLLRLLNSLKELVVVVVNVFDLIMQVEMD